MPSAGVEWVDIEHRKLVGVIDSLSWTFGNTSFAAIAYLVTDWRWLIITVTAPLILAIVTWRYESKTPFTFSHINIQIRLCLSKPSEFLSVRDVSASDLRWMPESARWLIASGKLEKAQTSLKRCATMNSTQGSIHTLTREVGCVVVVKDDSSLICTACFKEQ